MSEHTPGPWLRHDRSVYALSEGESVNRFYCRVDWGYSYYDKDYPMRTEGSELEANALLIAAAPDLLEALQALVMHFDDLVESEFGSTSMMKSMLAVADPARAAIAKATQP